jgi:AmmeMemoRadiSam system protein B
MAGRFYPADPQQCRAAAEALVKVPEGQSAAGGIGGIVPHAGWICSGAIAGETLGTLARAAAPNVVVVFGAVHTPIDCRIAALESHENWAVPGGECHAARELAESLEQSSDLFATDDRMHVHEHAVEVELPLIRAVWPQTEIFPVEVPMVDDAAEIGRKTARLLLDKGHKCVFLASSDFTHYGPSYRFAPVGVGIEAMNWAKENDRRLLRRIQDFEIEQIVPEVRQNLNACGAGAIAAMLAACKEAGAGSVNILRHAISYETLAKVAPQPPVDSVGYASVVVS